MDKNLELYKLLEDMKNEHEKMTDEEFEELYGYKPNEYHQAAIDLKEILSKKSPMTGLDGFALPEAMSYIIGDTFKLPLQETKKIAQKLIDSGHNTFSNEYDYGCADQYMLMPLLTMVISTSLKEINQLDMLLSLNQIEITS